jgi:hypothetical protein
VKSILGVSPKVNETWLGSVHNGLRVRVKGKTIALRVCEYECLVTSFVFGIVDILGLAALE